MALFTNADIQKVWLPLNINRIKPNNQYTRTVERPNNSLRLWDLFTSYLENNLSTFITNNLPGLETNIYTSDGILEEERTVDLTGSYDLTFRRGDTGSEEATLFLDASSGRVGINATSGETYGTLHVKSTSASNDGAVLSIANDLNSQITRILNDGRVRFDTYGGNTQTAAAHTLTDSGYIAGFATDGTIIEIDSSTFGGGGAASNYAITSLTADADRTHTWNTFNQSENFTTGIQTRTFDDEAGNITTATEQVGSFDYRTTNGTDTSGILALPLFTQIFATGSGTSNQFIIQDTGTYFQGDVPFFINATPGSAGDVLTSQGSGTRPLWVTPSVTSKTVSRKDADYTIVAEDVIVVHTNGGRTISLPASPSIGETHVIKQQQVTGTIISGNGNTIDTAANYTLPIETQSITVVYDSTEWVII
jgi:hypothetical protein